MNAPRASETSPPASPPVATAPPELSVVVVCERGLTGMAATLAALTAQTAADRIELIAVGPDDARMDPGALPPNHQRLGALRLLRLPAVTHVDHDLAPGVHAATAPVVALIEDHAFPEPAWAERTLAAWHAVGPGVAAIGFGVTNANPRSGFSWANMLLAYGRWMPADQGAAGAEAPDTDTGLPQAASGPTPVGWVAAHNVSLRRAALDPLLPRLGELTGREGLFLRELRGGGHAFAHAVDARIAHVNPSTPWATAKLRTDAGRLYGARRADEGGWGFGRRLAYVLLSPAIAPLRFVRERATHFGGGQRAALTPRVYPALYAALQCDALGQALGYALGAGGAPGRLATFEMDRARHVDAADRRACFGPQT